MQGGSRDRVRHDRGFAFDASGRAGRSGVSRARGLDSQRPWTGLADGGGQTFAKGTPAPGRDPSPCPGHDPSPRPAQAGIYDQSTP